MNKLNYHNIIIWCVFFSPTKHMIRCEIAYSMKVYLGIILKSDKGSYKSSSSFN